MEISRFPSPISRFPSPKIQFSSHKIQFSPIGFLLSSTAFCFLQWLSAFFNGFPTFFNGFLTFFNGFPIFLNGFPISKKSKKINLRRQIYERSLFELRISRHSLPKLRNSCYIVYISPTLNIANQNSDFLTLLTSEFQKKIRPESSESKTELELRLQWGSQKSEPKIGIPNQEYKTVHLTSIVHPQIEGKFNATPGGLTNLFYGCID